ncbi:uncharacterized protein LOC129220916 [Uloborus diversus]|uniref:uncharacterized protein LOC129220916 n=1 Tax=Uloborus diversus TaxID=327109 RepID=UPI00240976BA|nr:uncharacterized protein LOC129220916 [Uloborus diversus]
MYEFVASTASEKKITDSSAEVQEEVKTIEVESEQESKQLANEPEVPPPSEPPNEPPSEPPDDTPQRARTVSSTEDSNDTDSQVLSRIQRIEILQITEGPQLIEPSEVVIRSGAVYETAEPVLTPVEKLRRKDVEIVKAIEEKEKILADMFQVPVEELSNEIPVDTKDMTASELMLIAVQQATRLSSLINDGLNLASDDSSTSNTNDASVDDRTSCTHSSSQEKLGLKYLLRPRGISHHNLMPVSSTLSSCLDQLMAMVTDLEEDRKQLRKELLSAREQIHTLHETHRHCIVQSQSPSTHSRPSSFVSVGSTTSDCLGDIFEHQHLFSVLEKSEESVRADIPKEDSVTPQPSSSPESKEMPSDERWTLNQCETERTCESVESESNCDAPNTTSEPCGSDANCGDLSPIMESDSVCRTIPESVDPVYL